MSIPKKFREFYPKIERRLRQALVEAFTHRVLTLPPELRHIHLLDEALQVVGDRWPEVSAQDEDPTRPIFLFSAGWRSGSTLLQRLLCGSGEIVIWGEPLGDAAVLPRLAASLSVLAKGWPPDSYFADNYDLAGFGRQWIANVTPPMRDLRLAHRTFYDEWLAKPAQQRYGVAAWGFKEVRLTIEHARYLKWLYPNARFVFIYRNLVDAYRSWRGNLWASAWPGYYSWSPIAYARHWKLLLSGYLLGYREVDGLLVRYEDLVTGQVNLEALASHVGIERIDASVLEQRIASPDYSRKRRRKWVSPVERALLKVVAGDLMKQVGYR